MNNLERELKLEKENYTDIQVPICLKYSVRETLSNLPEQKKKHRFGSWNLTAAVLMLLIAAYIFHSDIPYKIKNIAQFTLDTLSKQLQEKNPVPEITSNINPYHPVIFAYKNNAGEFSNAEVLGGSKNGRWFKITDFSIKGTYTEPKDFYGQLIKDNFVDIDLIKGSETFNFYSNGKKVAYKKAEKPTLQIPPANGEKILSTKIGLVETENSFIIGINGTWNAAPGISAGSYKPGDYSIDLDNDGSKYILQILESKDKSWQSQIKVLIESNNKQIYVQDVIIDGIYTTEYDLSILDLNGDGRFEIVIIQKGHNVSASAYEFRDNKLTKVLAYYNGD